MLRVESYPLMGYCYPFQAMRGIVMPKSKKPARIPPAVSPEQALEIVSRLDLVAARFSGQIDELESAVGMFMLGRLFGWKVLVLIHNKRTIRKYEEILGINIREEFQEEGPFADKSLALEVAKKLGNFWKAVSGDLKDDELRAKRRELAS